MTATPRELSDAVQVDYDEIVSSRYAGEQRAIERWGVVRTVSFWVLASCAIILGTVGLLATLTGSLVAWILLLLFFVAGPFIGMPALAVWLVSLANTVRLEAKLTAKLFSLYGVTVDYSIDPPAYSVGTLPATWLKPELHRTRAILAGDAEPVAEEK